MKKSKKGRKKVSMSTYQMKTILLTIIAVTCMTYTFAQPPQIRRSIQIRHFSKDSISLHFDKDYFLIEDTCSSIIRYGHFDPLKRSFFGKFHDLNKLDPQIILAEGTYTADGKLDGSYTLRYLDNTLQAKGIFKEGQMRGLWEFFYEDGKPKLTLNVDDGGKVVIQQAWNTSGKKTIDNGKGPFRVDFPGFYWEGNLLNGIPDGTWKTRSLNDRTGTVLSSEVFKDGQFQKGSGPLGAYTDASRLVLISDALLPINNASKMTISRTACDPAMSRKSIVSAVYKGGSRAYSEEIINKVSPILNKLDLSAFGTRVFNIEGEFNEKGILSKLTPINAWEEKMSSDLIEALRKMPPVEPALVDGKPTAQKIYFIFNFNGGVYTISYRFLPITF
jgi:hypothetical protein